MTSLGAGLAIVADSDEVRCGVISGLVGRVGLSSAAVSTGADALDMARLELPALVVLAVDLEDPSGFEVCRELRDELGEALPIVFVSAGEAEPRDEIAGLLLGADDYFAMPLRSDRFVARIRRLVARSTPRAAATPLTKRETEVLTLLVEGMRPADIAEQLCISKSTASTHVEHILAKLGAHSQAQAVSIALRDGIVQLPGQAAAVA
jgi:DNA-binding NarL/FixJ family response regulator